jgi:hypothetical protein
MNVTGRSIMALKITAMKPALSGSLLAAALCASATAMAGGRQDAAATRIVVAEYLRAVPSEPTRACKRVCVKSKSEGNRSAPMCLQWKTVC